MLRAGRSSFGREPEGHCYSLDDGGLAGSVLTDQERDSWAEFESFVEELGDSWNGPGPASAICVLIAHHLTHRPAIT